MAPRTTPPASDQTTEQPPAPEGDTAQPTPEMFDWSALAPAVSMPNKVFTPGTKADVLTTTPESIRMRAESSLTVNTARVVKAKASSAARARPNYDWSVQPVANAKMGAEFVKLIERYGKYRPSDVPVPHAGADSPKGQITVRTGEPGYYRNEEGGQPTACEATDNGAYMGVRFSARPFEQRVGAARLPGTA